MVGYCPNNTMNLAVLQRFQRSLWALLRKTARVIVTQWHAFIKPYSPLSLSISAQLQVINRQPTSNVKHGYIIATVDSLLDVTHLAQFLLSLVVHGLILKGGPKFWVSCTPSYKDFFADSYGSASLFFMSTCVQLQEVSVWLGNCMFWWSTVVQNLMCWNFCPKHTSEYGTSY